MKKFLKEIFSGTELVGTMNLISGIIMALLWSYFASQRWSVAFGFLAVFFLVEAVWHYILTDYFRHIHKDHQEKGKF
jgi:membrane protein YdbS with pleckstrin-like domain